MGFTVPDLEQATAFFVDVIGCEYMFELGPFVAEDDWMEKHLNVHPRTVMRRLRFFRCKHSDRTSRFFSTRHPIKILPRPKIATSVVTIWLSMWMISMPQWLIFPPRVFSF